MPRQPDFTVPDAIWDNKQQACYDSVSRNILPNYAGLCLFIPDRGSPMVMNTWVEAGQRQWQHLAFGWCVPNKDLETIAGKAA